MLGDDGGVEEGSIMISTYISDDTMQMLTAAVEIAANKSNGARTMRSVQVCVTLCVCAVV